jgi:tRNA threonylcarbamoyladenosine biosynthesis protein TsaE
MISKSEEETVGFGKKFAEGLKPGDIVLLEGEPGSGKTRFVKGIAGYFRVKDVITSPTFNIVNEYTGKDPKNDTDIKIFHFDLYRINKEHELEEIGFEDYLYPDAVVIIEWPRKALPFLKNNYKKVLLSHGQKENIRNIVIEPDS